MIYKLVKDHDPSHIDYDYWCSRMETIEAETTGDAIDAYYTMYRLPQGTVLRLLGVGVDYADAAQDALTRAAELVALPDVPF